MKTGMKIKSYLDSKGISQTFLSTKTGIPLPKLNLTLNGKRNIQIEEYQSICWALDVGVDTFLEARPLIKDAAQ